ncbi:MAG: hypothetical protein AABX00_03560 [Nanoarchaeota archaeon]
MKQKNFALIFILVFLLAACGTSTTSKTVNVYTGTSGLIAEFLPNAPPAKVFEKSAFPIGLKIRNSGTYDIQNNEGRIAIGFEKDYIPSITFDDSNGIYQASENQVAFSIAGKTNFNQAGDEVVITSTAKTGNLEEQSESKNSLLTATLCYPYKTTLSATMCIDPDVVGLRPGKKICAVKDISLSGGQGAPIAITKIEPVMVPEVDNQNIRPQFLIYIENKANGIPVDKIKYKNVCDKTDNAATNMQKDNIWNVGSVKAFASGKNGEVQLQCCPNKNGECPEKEVAQNELEGFLRFRDNKDFIRCTFTQPVPRNLDAYTSPLRIEVDYGYIQTVTANFLLQKPLRH